MVSLLTTALAWCVALAGAVPYHAIQTNTNGLVNTTVSIEPAIPLIGQKENDVTTLQVDRKDCIVGLYEQPNFKGRAWGVRPLDMGDSPQTARCAPMVTGGISSIQFFKENFDRRAFSCYIFPDHECKGAYNDFNWIGDDQPDLSKIGFDKRVGSIGCYWNSDGSHWKRDIALTSGSPYDIALRLYQDAHFEGWYRIYTRGQVDKEECEADMPLLFGVSSIGWENVGQKWCAFYTSSKCNKAGLKLSWYGMTGAQDYVGSEYEDQINSAQCFKSNPPAALASSKSGAVKFSAEGHVMGEIGEGSN